MIELVLGGARSGKSHYAEQQALATGLEVVYIATAEAGDGEMARRIAHHRRQRSQDWLTVEQPVFLAEAVKRYASPEHCVLIDCLTLWLCNVLIDKQGNLQENLYQEQSEALLAVLAVCRNRMIFVSNDIGSGVVAADAVTRRFVDESGFLHQKIAKLSDRVVLITAGLPLVLK